MTRIGMPLSSALFLLAAATIARADNLLSTTSAQFSLNGVSTDAVTDCIPVVPGAFYDLKTEVLINVSGDAQGRAGIVGRQMTNGTCTAEKDPNFPNFAMVLESAATDWYPAAAGVLAKPGVVAVLVELRATQTSGTGTMTAHLRNAYLGPVDHPDQPDCADPAMPYDDTTATDALFALKSSVGSSSCAGCQCDTNNSGSVSASDALAILKHAVGQRVAIGCPQC